MKYEDIKQFVGKNVRVYVRGGFHAKILSTNMYYTSAKYDMKYVV